MLVKLYKKVSGYLILWLLACMSLVNTGHAQSTLIHFWSFNNWNLTGVKYTSSASTVAGANGFNASNPSIKADYSIIDTNKAVLFYKWNATTATTYLGYYDNYGAAISTSGSQTDFDTVNARTINGVYTNNPVTVGSVTNATNSFRMRNPSDQSYMQLYIPSTGYQNLVFTYGVEASNTSNAHTDSFAYSIDSGLTWIQTGINKTYDTTTYLPASSNLAIFKRITVNITDVNAANNPKLAFKIWQGVTNTGTSGNCRYDNISLDGTPIISINSQPANVSVSSGANATFSVSATGVGTLTYQWQVNTGSGFTNITNNSVYSGATTSTLGVTNVTSAIAGNQYQCVVTNSSPAYSLTSSSATLSLNSYALIHFWSFNYFDTVNVSGKGIPYTSSSYTGATNNNSNPSIKADYSLIDTNKAVLVYKWQPGTVSTYGGFYDNYPTLPTDFDTVNARTIPGYNTGTLATIQGFANANNTFRLRTPADKSYIQFYIPSTNYQNLVFTYGVEASNTTNCHTDTFYYSVDSGLTFIQSGISKTYDTTTYLPATSNLAIFKRITVNITDPNAINNPKLVFKITAGPVNGGNNRFDNVSLDGTPIITISSQPVSSTIPTGNSTSFSVSAAASGTLTYQWQVNTGTGFTNISNGGVYSNATTSTLNITNAALAMSGYQYQCVISNSSPASSLTTSAANLWVYTQLSTLIHFWDFNGWDTANYLNSGKGIPYVTTTSTVTAIGTLPTNNSNPILKADYSIIDTNKAVLSYNWQAGTPSTYMGYYDNYPTIPSDFDTVNIRTINGVSSNFLTTIQGFTGANNTFRHRNPSDKSYLVFRVPSTGYQNLVFTYADEASNNSNSHTDTFYYSIDSGVTWLQSGLSKILDTVTVNPLTTNTAIFKRITFNITDPLANNNPKLAVKITQGPQNTSTSGNNRYDNVSLDGTSIAGNNYNVSLSGTSACIPSTLSLTSSNPPLQVIWQNNGVTVATVVGNNSTTATTVGGTGTAGAGLTQLSSPSAVQADASNNIYICDQANNRVVKWASPYTTGVVVAGNGTAGNGLTQLNAPQQIFVDGSANIYVADKGNNRVVKWASPYTTGSLVAGTGVQGSSLSQLNGPTGVWVDASSNLYISDSGNNRIMKYVSGTGTIFAGNGAGAGASQLVAPMGITGDASGNVYVADKGNNRIQEFASNSSAGSSATTVAGSSAGTSGSTQDKLNAPVSVKMDIAGYLYITDQGNNRIQRWLPGAVAGATILTYTTGSSATQLNTPYDVTVDSAGNLYVADLNNNRVQKFPTNTTYTPTAAGSYTAIVTSAYGTSTTAAFAVSVPPTVTGNPSGITICESTNTTFAASGTGGAINRQWQVNTGTGFTNITNGGVYSGATTDSLKITGALATMTGYIYQCIYSDPCSPNATTSPATLTVTPKPTISTQPQATAVCAGLNTTIPMAATGAGITYQWQVNQGTGFTNITNGGVYSNATTNTLGITGAISTMNTYLYQCVVSGTCTPPAITNAITLTVNTAPSVGTNPLNKTICLNGSTTFAVAATSAGLSYQWQVNPGTGFTNITTGGGVYTNFTTNTLTITGATALMTTYQYQCVVSGTCSPTATSTPATLTVNLPAAISTQPANDTICNNGNASFTVAATGAGLTYQWFLTTGSGFSTLADVGPYTGSATPTLTITGANTGMSGLFYYCTVTGTCTPPATTSNALLIVNPNPTLTSNLIAPSVCNGIAINYTPAGSVAGTTYSWTRAAVSNISPLTGSGNGNINETLTNSSSAPVVLTYVYSLLANGCSATQSITDTVFPTPSVTLPSNQVFCNGVNTTALTLSGSSVAGTVYNWSNNTTSIGLAASGNTTIPVFNATTCTKTDRCCII